MSKIIPPTRPFVHRNENTRHHLKTRQKSTIIIWWCGGHIARKSRGGIMAMSMKDFLTLYFRQSHFDDMPEAKKSQFDSYVAKNDFRGDMKSWRDDLLKKDANGNLTKDA